MNQQPETRYQQLETRPASSATSVQGTDAPKSFTNLPDAPVASTPRHEPHGSPDGDESPAASGPPEPTEPNSNPPLVDLLPFPPLEPHEELRFPPTAVPDRHGRYIDRLAHTRDGTALAVFMATGNNATAMPIFSEQFQAYVIGKIIEAEEEVNQFKIKELITEMGFTAKYQAEEVECWKRCARFENGVEIALYDSDDTRVRVTPGKVKLVTHGSPTIFMKPAVAEALPTPSDSPNINLLDRYINLPPDQILLIIAWITYALCSPKCKEQNMFSWLSKAIRAQARASFVAYYSGLSTHRFLSFKRSLPTAETYPSSSIAVT